MPLVAQDSRLQYSEYSPQDTLVKLDNKSPTWMELGSAANRREGFLENFSSLLKQDQYFEPDPEYNLANSFMKNPWVVDQGLQGNFAKVRSQGEFDFLAAKIKAEQKDIEVLAQGGWRGFAALIAMGFIDPLTYIPLVGPYARGAQAFRQATKVGGAVMAAEEVVFQLNQETRTATESALNIGLSTGLSGLIGAGVGIGRTKQFAKEWEQVAQNFAQDLEVISNGTTQQLRGRINLAVPNLKPVGALESNPRFAGGGAPAGAQKVEFTAPEGFQGIWGTDTKLGLQLLEQLGPVTRQWNSPFDTARALAAQLSDAGLRSVESGRGQAVAPLGTIENLVKQYHWPMVQELENLNRLYSDYVTNGASPTFFRDVRGFITGQLRKDKLSKREFNEEISRALVQGGTYEGLPQAQAAAQSIKKNIYDPLGEQMRRVGLLGEGEELVGDLGYLNRLYNKTAIRRDTNAFLNVLARHFEGKLREKAEKRIAGLAEKETADRDLIRALEFDEGEVDEVRQGLEAQLGAMEAERAQGIEDEITNLRNRAADIDRRVGVDEQQEYKALLDQARGLEEANADTLKAFRKQRTAIRRQLRNLNQSVAKLSEKRAGKLARIDVLEQQQDAAFDAVIRRHERLLRDFDKLNPAKLEKEVAALYKLLRKNAGLQQRWDKRTRQLLESDDGDMLRVLGNEAGDVLEEVTPAGRAQELREKAVTRWERAADRLDDREDLLDNQEVLREILQAQFEEFRTAKRELNNRKGERIAKLRKDAEKYDPQLVPERVARLRQKMAERRVAVEAGLEKEGVQFPQGMFREGEDLAVPEMHVSDQAMADAIRVKDAILGTNWRVPGLDILQGERGPELARMLDIPSTELEPWLEFDVEKLIAAYVRTVGPDVELTRRFGSANAAELLDPNEGALKLEYERKRALAPTDAEKKAALKTLSKEGSVEVGGVTYGKGDRKALKGVLTQGQLEKAHRASMRDLTAMVSRLRHTYGLPNDPESIPYRMGKAALQLNTLTKMGMVAFSSVPDIARFTMKHGLMRTMRSGFVPLITDLKRLKMAGREAKLAGTALDVYLHTRMFEMLDLIDTMQPTSKLERGLEFATSKMGIVAGFDYWNSGMKQLAGAITTAEMMDSIGILAGGLRGNKSKAERYLAALNLDGYTVQDMWRLAQAGGADEVNGVWLPNTEDWLTAAEKIGMPVERAEDVQRLFRQALAREVDAIIVTPGLEKPLLSDSSIAGKLIFQFKSFIFSSTFRTFYAGLQERDTRFLTGTLEALALGALSYKLWATAAGYDNSEEGWDKWADEMIDRSGAFGFLGYMREVGMTIPGINDYVSFSGQAGTRRGGTGLANAVLGPSGDLLFTASRVVSDIDDPTQSTLHSMRKLTPYQNVWFLRRLNNALEEYAAEAFDIPERRGQ